MRRIDNAYFRLDWQEHGNPPPLPQGRKPGPAFYRAAAKYIACLSGARTLKIARGEPLVTVFYNRPEKPFITLLDPSCHWRLFEFATGCAEILRYQSLNTPFPSEMEPSPEGDRESRIWAMAMLKSCGLKLPRKHSTPKRPSTTVVQAGRKAAAKRYRDIAEALRIEAGIEPYNVDTERKTISGRAWLRGPAIACPEPTTRRRLWVYAHECAHILLPHADHDYKNNGKHLIEFEAEMWAIAALKRHGVPLPRKEIWNAKWNVARSISQDLRRGVKPSNIDRRAMRFAGVGVRELTVEATKARAAELWAACKQARRRPGHPPTRS